MDTQALYRSMRDSGRSSRLPRDDNEANRVEDEDERLHTAEGPKRAGGHGVRAA